MGKLTLKEQICTRAQELGIDLLGFAEAHDFDREYSWLVERKQDGRDSTFEESDIGLRCSPRISLPGAKTLISAAVAYPAPDKLRPPRDGVPRGAVSCHSWGRDYHIVLGEKLRELSSFIEERGRQLFGAEDTTCAVRTECFVDTGPLLDRAVARRAGLGFIGKNTCLITPEYGSWVFLGELVTNLELPPDEELDAGCGDCSLCLQACPTGALVEPYKLDSSRCLGYLTLQSGSIPEEFRTPLGSTLYGCDICQRVCPQNRETAGFNEEAFEPCIEEAYPRLLPLFSLSNREFREQFGHLAGAWRRLKTWQRNALVVLGNRRVQQAQELLKGLLTHERWEFRALSGWALGRLGDTTAVKALSQQLQQEKNCEVRRELEDSLVALTDEP